MPKLDPDQVYAAYQRFSRGDLSDDDLDLILESIEQALPYLGASSAFSLVHREAVLQREQLQGYQTERLNRKTGS